MIYKYQLCFRCFRDVLTLHPEHDFVSRSKKTSDSNGQNIPVA